MKSKASIALGISLVATVGSALLYLSLPDPVARMNSPGDTAGSRPDRLPAPVEGADADHPGHEPAPTLAEALVQKYAEAEQQRQKEIADAQKPFFVPPSLVLVKAGPELGLNEAQARKLEALRQSFIDGLKKLGKDPASPEYLEYWTQEQARLDDQLRLHLGEEAFLKLSARGLADATRAEKAGRR